MYFSFVFLSDRTVKEMHNSQEPLSSIEALIKRAIASKKRLNAQAAEKYVLIVFYVSTKIYFYFTLFLFNLILRLVSTQKFWKIESAVIFKL